MTAAKAIVETLGGRWYGSYGMARCPSHHDREPSLSVSDGRCGVSVHCFAGCDWRDVENALRANRPVGTKRTGPFARER